MGARMYYVTLQDENGVSIGGRLLLEADVSVDVIRNEGGHLVQELLNELRRARG